MIKPKPINIPAFDIRECIDFIKYKYKSDFEPFWNWLVLRHEIAGKDSFYLTEEDLEDHDDPRVEDVVQHLLIEFGRYEDGEIAVEFKL